MKTYGQLLYEILQRHENFQAPYHISWSLLQPDVQELYDTVAAEYDNETWLLSLERIEQKGQQKLNPN